MSRDESRRSKRARADRDFEMNPGSAILMNDYDDERTLDEEEALEASEDTHNELSHLQKVLECFFLQIILFISKKTRRIFLVKSLFHQFKHILVTPRLFPEVFILVEKSNYWYSISIIIYIAISNFNFLLQSSGNPFSQ